ncbi:hypothetical protein PR048_011598 [Dryococelus australis]|uniref:Uncharacterized protein n=1 Tax=Dryococelus australis TaxID=614101 RepID=A0ABQ9HM21_9NEOP|nr:hypothetical protein PR048_011598 [Dryococelus australis]
MPLCRLPLSRHHKHLRLQWACERCRCRAEWDNVVFRTSPDSTCPTVMAAFMLDASVVTAIWPPALWSYIANNRQVRWFGAPLDTTCALDSCVLRAIGTATATLGRYAPYGSELKARLQESKDLVKRDLVERETGHTLEQQLANECLKHGVKKKREKWLSQSTLQKELVNACGKAGLTRYPFPWQFSHPFSASVSAAPTLQPSPPPEVPGSGYNSFPTHFLLAFLLLPRRLQPSPPPEVPGSGYNSFPTHFLLAFLLLPRRLQPSPPPEVPGSGLQPSPPPEVPGSGYNSFPTHFLLAFLLLPRRLQPSPPPEVPGSGLQPSPPPEVPGSGYNSFRTHFLLAFLLLPRRLQPSPPPEVPGSGYNSFRTRGHARSAYSPHTKWVRLPVGSLPGFHMWQSCRTMQLVDGFYRGYPVPPPFHSCTAPYSPRFTPIGSQYHDVKCRINLSTLMASLAKQQQNAGT